MKTLNLILSLTLAASTAAAYDPPEFRAGQGYDFHDAIKAVLLIDEFSDTSSSASDVETWVMNRIDWQAGESSTYTAADGSQVDIHRYMPQAGSENWVIVLYDADGNYSQAADFDLAAGTADFISPDSSWGSGALLDAVASI